MPVKAKRSESDASRSLGQGMQPYWIKIEPLSAPTFLNLGVGITARTKADAEDLFKLAFGKAYNIASVTPISHDNELEQNHVLPNIGNWLVRGIWFPVGYETIAKEIQ